MPCRIIEPPLAITMTSTETTPSKATSRDNMFDFVSYDGADYPIEAMKSFET
jgi:hypothetical protein